MIARIWHGKTRRDRADAYSDFLDARAIPDYRSVRGNLAAYALRLDEHDETHFLTLSFWESEDSIRAFAGPDVLQAKYYPEDSGVLLELEPEVVHYQVVAGDPVFSAAG